MTPVPVGRDVGPGLVMAGAAGHWAVHRNLVPRRSLADLAGDVLFAICHDPNAAEGRGRSP
ncbi:hypothetical protein SMG44B_40011 [Stenotrophomonas maltophilia]